MFATSLTAAAYGSWAQASVPAGGIGLYATSCPTESSCYAVGAQGQILHSANANSTTATWTAQASGTTYDLTAVSCAPASSTCYAAGNSLILETTDGGATWNKVIYPVSAAAACAALGQGSPCASVPGLVSPAVVVSLPGQPGARWSGMSCVSATRCTVVAQGAFSDVAADPTHSHDAAVLSTTDGSTWVRQYAPAANGLTAVSCPSATECVAGGVGGNVVHTTDGGATWTLNATFPIPDDIGGIACPTTSTCFANLVDNSGNDVLVDTGVDQPGGGTWALTAGASGNHAFLYGISCPNTTTCFAVGGNDPANGNTAEVITTSSGGTSWGLQNSAVPSPGTLRAVTCSALICEAAGSGGTGAVIVHN